MKFGAGNGQHRRNVGQHVLLHKLKALTGHSEPLGKQSSQNISYATSR